MVAIWIKLFLILLAGIGAVFGTVLLSEKSGMNVKQELDERMPEDMIGEGKNWIASAPLKDIWNLIAGGTKGTVTWLVRGINMIAGWLLHFLSPSIRIPATFGTIIFAFLMILLLWKGYGTFHDWGYEFMKWALVIGGGILALWIGLTLTGVI